MKNIVFFGASVTQQKNGYVDIFTSFINKSNPEFLVQKYGFGSMHLRDAGICFIDEIILQKPSYCFIDWFTTAMIYNCSSLKTYLDCIVRKLKLINSKIVFLLLHNRDINERQQMYIDVISYANEYNIFYIEIYKNDNSDQLLRDTVHTNEYGSNFYGEKIYDYFTNNVINNNSINNNIIDKIPPENEFYIIKKLPVNKIINKKIILKGEFKLIGCYQKIGPFSGLYKLTINNDYSNSIIYNLWDKHCHYERFNIKLNVNKVVIEIEIEVLQDRFDTTTCTRDLNFDKNEKYIDLNCIFYTGELKICLIDDETLVDKIIYKNYLN